jgi:translation initiation factor 2 subunit 2
MATEVAQPKVELAEPAPAEVDGGDAIDWGKKKTKKKAAAKTAETKTDEAAAPVADKKPEEKDYDYSELLVRIFEMLNKGDPQSKTTRIPVPNLGRIGTKRTCITNFKEICNAIHRPPEHLMSYLSVELGSPASLDGNAQQMVAKGRFQQSHIEKVIKHYIREYVICKVCKSYDTSMEKENRLNFVKCASCNSRLSVSQIRQGFQAQIGKRKQQG